MAAPSATALKAPVMQGRQSNLPRDLARVTISVSNTVAFNVKGTINDQAGIAQPFSFKLTCVRLEQEQITNKLSSDTDSKIVDFLADVVEDWSGVRDDDDKPLPYSEDALRKLCKISGVAAVAFHTYLAEVGAKAKN